MNMETKFCEPISQPHTLQQDMVHYNRMIAVTKKMRETYQKHHLFYTPPETKLFLQHSVIAAASQQTSPSAQRCTPIKEKQTGHFNFVNLTCKQHDRAKSPTSPAVSWGLFDCVCEGICVCKRDFVRWREKLFCACICLCMQNVLEWQRVCDGRSEKRFIKMCVSSKEVEVARGGRRGWGEAAGAVRSPVRSEGETQFTLPCRHPG